MNVPSDALEKAVKMVVTAGALASHDFREKKNARLKEDGTLVTDTDGICEREIIAMIEKAYPDHSIESEETGLRNKQSDFSWIVDPLDGTYNFVYGIPIYGVSVALAYKDKPVLGAINFPEFGQLFTVQKGKGAFLNGDPIGVSGKKGLQDALLVCGSLLRRTTCMAGLMQKLAATRLKIRTLGCVSFGMSLVAGGKADGYIEPTVRPQDIAASCLMVEEAGGKVTDFFGKPWSIRSDGVIASNGLNLREMLDAVSIGATCEPWKNVRGKNLCQE